MKGIIASVSLYGVTFVKFPIFIDLLFNNFYQYIQPVMEQVNKRVTFILIREINNIVFIVRMEMFNQQSEFISKLLKMFGNIENISSKTIRIKKIKYY